LEIIRNGLRRRVNGPGRPCSLGRSRVPVYRSGALSSMEAAVL
jgi:hypothetical protein